MSCLALAVLDSVSICLMTAFLTDSESISVYAGDQGVVWPCK